MQTTSQPANEITSIVIQRRMDKFVKVVFIWSDNGTSSSLEASLASAKRMLKRIGCSDLPTTILS